MSITPYDITYYSKLIVPKKLSTFQRQTPPTKTWHHLSFSNSNWFLWATRLLIDGICSSWSHQPYYFNLFLNNPEFQVKNYITHNSEKISTNYRSKSHQKSSAHYHEALRWCNLPILKLFRHFMHNMHILQYI